MDQFAEAHGKIIVETTIESLKKHGFEAEFFQSREDAANFIMSLAADCQTVGVAGTLTVRALGVLPKLQKAGKTLFDHWQEKPGSPEDLQCRKNQMGADLFLASVNALAATGEIVNRDGCGNRVNSMTFGPGKVVLVAGRNKIVPDLDAAFARLENTAGPIRAMSLNRKTPCTKTGYLHGL